MHKQSYTPTHPGEILKEEFQVRGITQSYTAEALGISYHFLRDILNAKKPVTVELASRLEAKENGIKIS